MLRKTTSAMTTDQQQVASSPITPRKRITLIFFLGSILGCVPGGSHGASLDCPQIGLSGAVSNLLSDVQVKLVSSGNSIDLANEIYDLINKLQTESPNTSYNELTDMGLLSGGRKPGEPYGFREMASHEAVRYDPAAAARCQYYA
jgi:hypothetical protein